MFWVSRHHLLPEAYIYGLADTKISAASLPSYLFGHVTHRASRWYYSAAFAIKSTLPFLILLSITVVALISKRWRGRREVIVLTVPPAVLFIIASTSDIGIGFRHLLPIFPMLYFLIAGCVSHLVSQNRWLLCAFGVLLLWQTVTPLAARPGLLAYANDLWHQRVDGTADDKTATGRQLIVSILAASLIGFFFIWAIYPSGKFLKQGRNTEALAEAESARSLDPASATAWKALGDALEASGRSNDARAAYQSALQAHELDPVFQKGLITELQKKLAR
jgi:hypothetical protein